MKPLIGRQRTHARRAVAALATYQPAVVARLLGMRLHTVSAILSGRMLPGPRFALAVTRVTSPA